VNGGERKPVVFPARRLLDVELVITFVVQSD
jgi:hypothetical protein